MLLTKTIEKIKKLINEKQTPFFVYDKNLISEKCNLLKSSTYQETNIHFAVMANSNFEFLNCIKNEGLGIFVNSIPHLYLAKKVGFKKEQIIFTASSMDEKTMILAAQEASIIHLDSINQIKKWTEKFPNKKVGIRVNIDNSFQEENSKKAGLFIGPQSRLGIDSHDFSNIPDPKIINGLHIYVGTNVLNLDYFISYYIKLIELSVFFPNIEHIDFGGGFGVDNTLKSYFNFNIFYTKVSEIMNHLSAKKDKSIKLILEPGRIIAADTAYFVCKIIDIKNRNNKQIIVTNASVAQFPRPLLYPEDTNHPVFLLSKLNSKNKEEKINSDIVGCSTYSRDYLAKNIILPRAEIDDSIIFCQAGAYCSSLYTKFLGFPQAKEFFI